MRAVRCVAMFPMPFPSRREFLCRTLASLGWGSLAGCGTVLHPERRGQQAGPYDWSIVALDAVGLLFFFVPGVIAFAVDFATGAIYLPPSGYGRVEKSSGQAELLKVDSHGERVSVQTLERVVSEHTGQSVRLKPGGYETVPLATLDEFWPTADRYTAS